MTHLRIEQNTTGIEEASASIISKLYELAYAGLDASSNLLGRLHAAKAYGDEIDWLTSTYSGLYINADERYIKFADPEVLRILTSNWGDNIGVTLADILNKSSINSGLFNNNTTITSFTELNDFTSITTLGYSAFYGCSNLTNIGLNNIRYIGWESFRDCGITGVVNLPNVINVGNTGNQQGGSFTYSDNITLVNCGENTQIIGLASFLYCTGLTSFTCTSPSVVLGDYAFLNCSSLTTVSIPGVTSYGGAAFSNCTSLKTANVPLENIVLGGYLFDNCGELEISVPSEITIGGFSVFAGCHKATFPQLLTVNYNDLSIRPNWAFSQCYNLTKVKLGQNVQHIGKGMFYECSSLTEIQGLENVLYISDQSFVGCTGLTGTLDLSSCINFSGGFYGGTNNNGIGPFHGCTGITKIILGDFAFDFGGWHTMDYWRPLFGNMANLKTVDFKSLSGISNVQNNTGYGITGWFVDCPNMENFIIRSTTIPPKVNQNDPLDIRHFGGSNVTIWVPDSAVSDYQAAWPEVASYIRGLSNLPSSV